MASNVERAIADLLDGKAIIVVDDFDREFEGDLVIAAEKATKEVIAHAMLHARGLMCLPTSGEILDALEIPMMVDKSTDPLETAFTVSVDGMKTTTGMSVFDRLETISVLLNPESKPEELQRPGHLFPLRPKAGLLQERRGHTETSIELMKLCGLREVAIIVEIMNDDGTMKKGTDLEEYAEKHDLVLVSVEEVYNHVYNSGV